MEKDRFQKVVEDAARGRGCTVVDIDFNDDDNVFEVTLDKEDGRVDLSDCEYVHRAVLGAFDRVSSAGLDPAEADEMLETIKE